MTGGTTKRRAMLHGLPLLSFPPSLLCQFKGGAYGIFTAFPQCWGVGRSVRCGAAGAAFSAELPPVAAASAPAVRVDSRSCSLLRPRSRRSATPQRAANATHPAAARQAGRRCRPAPEATAPAQAGQVPESTAARRGGGRCAAWRVRDAGGAAARNRRRRRFLRRRPFITARSRMRQL